MIGSFTIPVARHPGGRWWMSFVCENGKITDAWFVLVGVRLDTMGVATHYRWRRVA